MIGRSAIIRLGSDDLTDARLLNLTPELRRRASECWIVSLIDASTCVESLVTDKWPHAVAAAKAWIEVGQRLPKSLKKA